MTRRIALSILLTVWAAILIAGVTSWLTARKALLDQFDQAIKDHATSLNSLDRYAVKDVRGRTVDGGIAGRFAGPAPTIIERTFVELPEGTYRRLVLQVPGQALPVSVSVPADQYVHSLRWLGGALAISGVLAGAVAAIVAAWVARLALRPLSHTAEVVGAIDQSKLDRRIDAAALPEELRPMAGRLNELLGRLQHAFEERRRFLADASHELRTPVAAMITTMEVALRRPRPAAELTETLETCLSEARHMRQLVQALLRQIRAEAASGDEEAQDLDAAQMLRECADLADSLALQKQIHIVRSVNGAIPVRAEPGRLRSVVLNLMSNAIEYNHPGGMVEVSAHADEASAEIVVRDDGPGIAPEHLPHLFEPFYRATAKQESDGHLGLGLFLVDSHVKAMGGECRVESRLGAGTTFRIRLPSSTQCLATTEAL